MCIYAYCMQLLRYRNGDSTNKIFDTETLFITEISLHNGNEEE